MFTNYEWKQTAHTVVVNITLPDTLKKAAHLITESSDRRLYVGYASRNEQPQVIIDGTLSNAVRKVDITWTVCMKANLLRVHIEKPHTIWWKRLYMCEPEQDEPTADEKMEIDEQPDDTPERNGSQSTAEQTPNEIYAKETTKRLAILGEDNGTKRCRTD